MSKTTMKHQTEHSENAEADPLRELLRKGVQELQSNAVQEEVQQYLEENATRRTEDDRAAVVRNGYNKGRDFFTTVGTLTVNMPKVRSHDEHPAAFHSALVPPYMRRSKSVDTALPWLYLNGMSTGKIAAVLATLIGEEQYRNLSPAVVSRLKKVWHEQYRAWSQRSLAKERYVYIWA